MFTLVAYYQSIDPAAVLAELNAVPDQHIFTNGSDVRVPDVMSNLIGEVALTAAANLLAARISSPSLRAVALKDMEPIVGAVTFGSPPEAIMHPLSPNPLAVDEALNLLIDSDPASGEAHYGLVWLADGVQQPVAGNIFTLAASTSITQVVGVWVNGNITLGQDLPVGVYQIVGMRVRSTDAVAARLVFRGGAWRPGCPAVNAISDLDPPIFRMGRMGVWGEFEQTTPPSMDILGGVATAQTIFLDLIKVG